MWLVLSAAIVVSVACGGSDESQSTAKPTTQAEAPTPSLPPPTPKPPPANAVPFSPDTRTAAEALLTRVAEIRKSPPRGPINMFTITRQAAIDYYTPTQTSDPNERKRRGAITSRGTIGV